MNHRLQLVLRGDIDSDMPRVRDPYMMQIVNVAFIERCVRDIWRIARVEYNLADHNFYPINDWCITEAFSRVLGQQGVHITDHRRYDEARCLYDTYFHSFDRNLRYQLKKTSVLNWIDCEAKVMVLGYDAIIARTVPASKY